MVAGSSPAAQLAINDVRKRLWRTVASRKERKNRTLRKRCKQFVEREGVRRTGKNGNSKRRRHGDRKMMKRGGAVEENRETVKTSVRG